LTLNNDKKTHFRGHFKGYTGGLACSALIILAVHFAIQAENKRRATPLRITKAPWRTSFFHGTKLEGEKIAQTISNFINFNWKGKDPFKNVSGSSFSARFQSCILAEQTQKIYFKLNSDDGIRIYIDSKIEFESWHSQLLEKAEFEHFMTKGLHKVEIEYYQVGGPSQLKLQAGAHKKKLTKIPTNEKIILAEDFSKENPCHL